MNKKSLIIIYSLLGLTFVVSIISFATSVQWCTNIWNSYYSNREFCINFYGSLNSTPTDIIENLTELWRQAAILTVIDVFSLVSAITSAGVAALLFLKNKKH